VRRPNVATPATPPAIGDWPRLMRQWPMRHVAGPTTCRDGQGRRGGGCEASPVGGTKVGKPDPTGAKRQRL